MKNSRLDKGETIHLKHNDVVLEESMSCAEKLNSYFVSVFNSNGAMNFSSNIVTQECIAILEQVRITEVDVLLQLQTLNITKSKGPDNIPSFILKQCRRELAYPLMLLYNKSLETSILPQDWRDANVKPIFKSGDKTQCENYRPISLTCIAVKVFEKILLMKIERFVEENKLIHNSQYGFRRNKSCESQLLQYTHYLCKNFDKKNSSAFSVFRFTKGI